MVTRYNGDGLPESTSGLTWYTADATYSPYGEVLRTVSGSQPHRVWTTNFVDPHTGSLQRTVTDRETADPHRITDSYYSYDVSGTITSNARKLSEGPWDTQCFTYDVMGELVHAWTSNITPTGNGTGCKAANGTSWGYRTDYATSSGPVADAPDEADDATTPDSALTASLAAAAPASTAVSTGGTAYRQSFTFDWIGNRATWTDHDTSDPTKNVKYTYAYGGTAQPHTMTSVTSSPTGKGSTYKYDATGNTTDRNLPGTTQDLAWSSENKLDSITNAGTKTTYVYDADGNRILENSPSGSTLYLGETELTTNASGTITKASRSYAQAGAPTVVRTTTNGSTTGHKLSVLLADHLGTANTSVDVASGQTVTRRAFKPYGEVRGAKPTAWPNKRSYVGTGIDDATTGLTHIGAREYDQASGRFLSADPIIDLTDPLQINGYSYAKNSPISSSDPTGLCPKDICDGYGQNTDTPSYTSGSGSGSAPSSASKATSGNNGRDPAEIREDTIRHNAAVKTIATYLRAFYWQNPAVQVSTGVKIPNGGTGKTKDGFADIVVYFDDYIFIWEVKSAKTAEKAAPAQLRRYVNAMGKEQRKYGKTVQRGFELPQMATMDPLNPKQQLVMQSTRARVGSPHTDRRYEGVVGWWTRKQSTRTPKGMEPSTVPAPLTIQVWQPTPAQQRQIAWSAMAAGTVYVLGKMVTSPFGLE